MASQLLLPLPLPPLLPVAAAAAAAACLLLLLPAAARRLLLMSGHTRSCCCGTQVATPEDPASARRGEPLYAFIPRSIWGNLVDG